MKAIARNTVALIVTGALLSLAACGAATTPEVADPSEAMPEEPGDAAEAEKPKKSLEGMKGDRMEKAGEEE